MRTAGLLVIILLIISVFSPVSFHFEPAGKDKVIVALDVCNPDGSFFSVNGDAKEMCISTYNVPVPELTGSIGTFDVVLKPTLIPYKKERPPRV